MDWRHAHKHGTTDGREVTELVEGWKQAARHTKHLHRHEHARHKRH
jgi:hypothetical protein